ncbi:MAG: Crp/Fnr family transcriptional regulator [Candidatus Zixiibacteriota bacterium]|nr:MAG: Crp/Fnr family transcriptional regulator [candidate division Zixibacteria bacterium]
MEVRKLLSQTRLCQRLNESELDAIARIASLRNVNKGTTLFLQGDEATGFFLLVRGLVRIYKSSPEGREYTMHIVKPGEMFAEAAIFEGRDFPANCDAIEDSVVAFFPREAFTQLIMRSPQISMKMIAALSAFLRDLAGQVEELSLKEIPARLAAYLLTEARTAGDSRFVLPITKTELAHKLGTISETLSRNLKKFRTLQLIEMNGREIVLLDRDKLEAIAAGEKI